MYVGMEMCPGVTVGLEGPALAVQVVTIEAVEDETCGLDKGVIVGLAVGKVRQIKGETAGQDFSSRRLDAPPRSPEENEEAAKLHTSLRKREGLVVVDVKHNVFNRYKETNACRRDVNETWWVNRGVGKDISLLSKGATCLPCN